MSKPNLIHLSEVNDHSRKVYDFSSFEAIGGRSNEFDILDFHLNLSVIDAGDGYYVSGSLKLKREFPCSICSFESVLNQELPFDEFIRIDPSFDADSEVIAKSDESKSLVLKTPTWDILEFARETINLEEPSQFYPRGEDCKTVCPNYLVLVQKGILIDTNAQKNNPAFDTLKNYQFKG